MSINIPRMLFLTSLAMGVFPIATPKNVVHGLHIPPGPVPVPTSGGHLGIRQLEGAAFGNMDPYDRLLSLLRDIYGNEVGKVLQDPEWLSRVCFNSCDDFDFQCHDSCGSQYVEYLEVSQIFRCASNCEHLDHSQEENLRGEYGACLVPCLLSNNASPRPAGPPHQLRPVPQIPVADPPVMIISPSPTQSYPYKATQISVTETTVFDIIGPAPPLIIPTVTLNSPTNLPTTPTLTPLPNDMTTISVFTPTPPLETPESRVEDTPSTLQDTEIASTSHDAIPTDNEPGPPPLAEPSSPMVNPNTRVPQSPQYEVQVEIFAVQPAPIRIDAIADKPLPNDMFSNVTQVFEAIDPIPFYPGDDNELHISDVDATEGLPSVEVEVAVNEDVASTVEPIYTTYIGSNGTLTTETLAVPIIHPTAVMKFANLTMNSANATSTASSPTTSTGSRTSSATLPAGLDLSGGAAVAFEVSIGLRTTALTLLAAVVGFGLLMG